MKLFIKAEASVKSKTSKLERAEGKLAKLQDKFEELKDSIANAKEAVKEAKKELRESIREEKKRAKPVSAAPSVRAAQTESLGLDVSKYTVFDRKIMQGKEWQKVINSGCKFPAKTEGYWRDTFKPGKSKKLPFPIISSVAGYDKADFLEKLAKAQRSARKKHYKGTSPNRWTGKPNGSAEYSDGVFRWPEGYRSYVSKGVPPSKAFYKHITGKTNANLPY